jgi:hypothetical protein
VRVSSIGGREHRSKAASSRTRTRIPSVFRPLHADPTPPGNIRPTAPGPTLSHLAVNVRSASARRSLPTNTVPNPLLAGSSGPARSCLNPAGLSSGCS